MSNCSIDNNNDHESPGKRILINRYRLLLILISVLTMVITLPLGKYAYEKNPDKEEMLDYVYGSPIQTINYNGDDWSCSSCSWRSNYLFFSTFNLYYANFNDPSIERIKTKKYLGFCGYYFNISFGRFDDLVEDDNYTWYHHER